MTDSYLILTLIFVTGTPCAGFLAARRFAAWPLRAAILAGLGFEALLLIAVQPGLSALAVLIAITCTTLLAGVGALLGRKPELSR
jgi:Na+/citrate or Na+/malate symporter